MTGGEHVVIDTGKIPDRDAVSPQLRTCGDPKETLKLPFLARPSRPGHFSQKVRSSWATTRQSRSLTSLDATPESRHLWGG